MEWSYVVLLMLAGCLLKQNIEVKLESCQCANVSVQGAEGPASHLADIYKLNPGLPVSCMTYKDKYNETLLEDWSRCASHFQPLICLTIFSASKDVVFLFCTT